MAIRGQRAMEIVRRRQQVSELYLQGWTQTDIAERLRNASKITSRRGGKSRDDGVIPFGK